MSQTVLPEVLGYEGFVRNLPTRCSAVQNLPMVYAHVDDGFSKRYRMCNDRVSREPSEFTRSNQLLQREKLDPNLTIGASQIEIHRRKCTANYVSARMIPLLRITYHRDGQLGVGVDIHRLDYVQRET